MDHGSGRKVKMMPVESSGAPVGASGNGSHGFHFFAFGALMAAQDGFLFWPGISAIPGSPLSSPRRKRRVAHYNAPSHQTAHLSDIEQLKHVSLVQVSLLKECTRGKSLLGVRLIIVDEIKHAFSLVRSRSKVKKNSPRFPPTSDIFCKCLCDKS